MKKLRWTQQTNHLETHMRAWRCENQPENLGPGIVQLPDDLIPAFNRAVRRVAHRMGFRTRIAGLVALRVFSR